MSGVGIEEPTVAEAEIVRLKTLGFEPFHMGKRRARAPLPACAQCPVRVVLLRAFARCFVSILAGIEPPIWVTPIAAAVTILSVAVFFEDPKLLGGDGGRGVAHA